MTNAQWTGTGLFVCCGLLVLVFAADYNLPGNAVIPGRIVKPFAYWGNVAFFGGFALFGLYGATIGF
ncbi:hypothetical protein L288_09850 [Sphingobium quisquiliarum P25]|uniref:Uncharacterized protein n=1 Tax=Sphingobium quisquiliarum P25 TaxID=1329909 RepID=T0ICR3_9SPHN|nr:hypothetical protein [Sphingobium quisquiliarum]EQB07399.1 hypothetical protein L288_09850 [Sphingobium quisquiliarum P25]